MKMQNIIMQIEMLEVIPCCGLQINNALSNNEIPALDFVFPAIFFVFCCNYQILPEITKRQERVVELQKEELLVYLLNE